MTKVLVIEDEFAIAMDIKTALESMGYEVTGTAQNYEEGLLAVAENKPDIILMDINLGEGKSGIDLAEKVYSNFKIPFLFVTAFSDPETFSKAMKTYPMGYVVKPFKDLELKNGIELALLQHRKMEFQQNEITFLKNHSSTTTTTEEEPHIFIKNKTQLSKVFLSDIIYLEALDNYTNLYTTDKKHTVNGFLKDIHQRLPEKKFIRIHKSFVINIDAIKSVDDNLIYLKNNTSVPVSKSFRQDFMNRINII